MAKILAFIPTRERNTVHIPANILAPFVDKIVVMSKGADTTGLPDNSTVIEQSWTGLQGVREVGDVMAYEEGFDYILQADDDIRFPPELVANLIQLMEDNPGLGACCSLSSVQYYWNREVQSNKHFLVAPFPSQLTLMRAKLVPELQQAFGTVYGGLGTMEDVAKGVHLWSLGYPSVYFRADKELVHNVFIPRLKKSKEMGGQPISERSWMMHESVEYLQKFVGPDNVLKSAKLGYRKDGQATFRLRWNWDWMCGNVKQPVGYEDSKGRTF